MGNDGIQQKGALENGGGTTAEPTQRTRESEMRLRDVAVDAGKQPKPVTDNEDIGIKQQS